MQERFPGYPFVTAPLIEAGQVTLRLKNTGSSGAAGLNSLLEDTVRDRDGVSRLAARFRRAACRSVAPGHSHLPTKSSRLCLLVSNQGIIRTVSVTGLGKRTVEIKLGEKCPYIRIVRSRAILRRSSFDSKMQDNARISRFSSGIGCQRINLQTLWRCAESCANRSLHKVPANREKIRDSAAHHGLFELFSWRF